MDLKQQLQDFYNQQATNFHISRQKKWPEFNYFLKAIKSSKKKHINILELWCWSWRFFWFLKENTKKKINYYWIDFSENLINIAKQEYQDWNFETVDMLTWLEKFSQNQFDFVVAIASFQHLDTNKQRLLTLKHIYRLLNYWWALIMSNWSFSKWFIKKYYINILNSLINQILWKYSYNDIFVPWKDNILNKIYYRYYHIFTISELTNLLKLSWFIIEIWKFIDKNWNLSNSWINSRNSFFIAKKDVLK